MPHRLSASPSLKTKPTPTSSLSFSHRLRDSAHSSLSTTTTTTARQARPARHSSSRIGGGGGDHGDGGGDGDRGGVPGGPAGEAGEEVAAPAGAEAVRGGAEQGRWVGAAPAGTGAAGEAAGHADLPRADVDATRARAVAVAGADPAAPSGFRRGGDRARSRRYATCLVLILLSSRINARSVQFHARL